MANDERALDDEHLYDKLGNPKPTQYGRAIAGLREPVGHQYGCRVPGCERLISVLRQTFCLDHLERLPGHIRATLWSKYSYDQDHPRRPKPADPAWQTAFEEAMRILGEG